jgi:ankyrin repeat protein
MKILLVALSPIAVLMLAASTTRAQEKPAAGLSVAIVVEKDNTGNPTIDRQGTFKVVFTNRSREPIRIWSEDCQLGYETLSFRVEDADGTTSLMYKRTPQVSNWRNKPRKSITILPEKSITWEVGPSHIWGERVWKNAPEPNTGKPTRLTAVLSIKPTDAARKHGVWTGEVRSEPAKALVVDATLRTPHQYLWDDCPKQALKVMKADRTWINKKDEEQCAPLHHAARFGHVEVVSWLLANGAEVNATAYNQFTPLHFARNVKVVGLLIQYKADLNAWSAGGSVVERLASDYAHTQRFPDLAAQARELRNVIEVLKKAGAEYSIRSACYLGDIERVRALVAAQKKQARDKEALRWAATYGRTKIVKFLLENGADPENAGYGGLPVSYFALEHADVLKLLFDAGANPKVRVEYRGDGRGPRGSSLLVLAAQRGYLESAKLLGVNGLDVNQADAGGATPLHAACWGGHARLVEWLLQNKANPRARTKVGGMPMDSAVYQIRPEHDEDNAQYEAVIRALVGAGVEMDVFAAIACNDVERVAKILERQPKAGEQLSADGRPALHTAVTLDRREIVKRLFDKGADPDVRSREKYTGHEGETALLQAAFWGRLAIAELLIKHGAKVNARAAKDVVPLHEAARMGYVELARLLLKHGAEVNARDADGKTPLDWAGTYRELAEMGKLLREHGAKK